MRTIQNTKETISKLENNRIEALHLFDDRLKLSGIINRSEENKELFDELNEVCLQYYHRKLKELEHEN